jgi:hypothetical protein
MMYVILVNFGPQTPVVSMSLHSTAIKSDTFHHQSSSRSIPTTPQLHLDNPDDRQQSYIMADHNFNVMGEDLCQFIGDSSTINEADDNKNNIMDIVEQQPQSGQAVIISPPLQMSMAKEGSSPFERKYWKKALDDLVNDFDKYLEEESAHDCVFLRRVLEVAHASTKEVGC